MSSLISVLMPARNVEPYIEEAIRSVLDNGLEEIEVVVVDDRSTDETRAVAAGIGDPRIRILEGPGEGLAAALNVAHEAMQGRFITRCDADDLFPKGRLARQLEWLEAHPEFGAVGGLFESIDPSGRHVARMSCGETPEEITEEMLAGTTRTTMMTFMMRREAVDRTGPYRTFFRTASDIDWQLRFCEVTRVYYLPELTYSWRLHDASNTHSVASKRRDFFDATARAFASQRRETGEDDLMRGRPPEPPAEEGPVGGAAEHRQGLLMGQAWRDHAAGSKWRAVATGLRACLESPRRLATWRQLAALVIKRAGAREG